MKSNRNLDSATGRSARGQRFGGVAIVVSLLLGVLVALVPGHPANAQTTGDPPALSVGDVALSEGNSGTKAAVFSISRAGDLARPSSVTVATADDTAIANGDFYAQAPVTVNFVAGQPTQTVSVTVRGDARVEPDERFFVKLSAPADATIADDTGVGTIVNDDTALVVNNVAANEGHSGTKDVSFIVTRSGVLSGTSTVNVATANGTAVAPEDYCATSGTVTFAAGEASKAVPVCIKGDTVVEPNETFFLNLSAPTGATIADSSGQATIKNDDQALAVNDVSVTEGNGGQVLATFTISRSGVLTGYASVTWATENGTATAPSDYVAQGPTQVTLAPNQASLQVSVPVNGDVGVEENETFSVKLSAASGTSISDDTGVGTIVNDDASFVISDPVVQEGNSGTRHLLYTITRLGDVSRYASVCLQSSGGTAGSGADYLPPPSTCMGFAAGERTKAFSVVVVGDIAVEPDETVCIWLSSPSGATISDGYGCGIILNDDAPASIRSHNYPTHYMRQKGSFGELTRLNTELDIREGTFKIVPGLADARAISFESTASPGSYLRHQNFRLTVQPRGTDQLYKDDATFYPVAGLADGTKMSFQSKNFPTHHIRHQGFHLYLHQGSDPVFQAESTYQVVAPPAPTSTVEVPDVVGMDEVEAEATLEASGFVVSVRRPLSCGAEPYVTAQSPDAGTIATVGSTVTIAVPRDSAQLCGDTDL